MASKNKFLSLLSKKIGLFIAWLSFYTIGISFFQVKNESDFPWD